MTEPIDPSDPSTRQPRPLREPRLGDSRSPVTTIVVLAVAAVAVIAGFIILQSVTEPASGDDVDVVAADATTSATAPPAETAAPAATTTTSTSTTTTTEPRASKSDATILVANASGVGGSASAMAAELTADGYTLAPVGNSTGPRLERSIIHYVPGNAGALGVARLLAEEIPSAQTLPMPDPPPLDRPLNRATVALLLGFDAAGKTLAELQAG